jgi:hypothetical protein
MSRVIHFEIGAVDTGKIKKFYTDVFGWKMEKWGGGEQEYWLVATGETSQPGINGGIFKSKGEAVIVNTIDVKDLDEMCRKVESAGGKIEVPKMAVPGIGWLAYFKDVEGNLFGIMQGDENAK